MRKILIIEGDIVLMDVLESWLTLENFCTFTAITSQQGYELAKLKKPDLILCCYKLPDFNGLELLKKIRQDPETQAIPFLLITGAELKMMTNWQTYLTPDDIVRKPFSITELWPKIQVKLSRF